MDHVKNVGVVLLAFSVVLAGCRKDDLIIPEEEVPLPPENVVNPLETQVMDFYLLNEGNMNMNKASLDYCDYANGKYRRNIYGQANPTAVMGLGDVGNDLGIYGSKLYAVINCSNKLEVMDVATTKRVGVVDILNCRYVTFARGKAYVSAYNGKVQIGADSPYGFIAEIDTASLTITRTVVVGRQPEEMAVVGDKLYVANSGGYSPPNYERTVSVIDLNTFTRLKDIDVAINLHRLKADSYGDLYVSSRGDYYDIPSRLFVIDTKTDAVKKTFDIACANFTIAGDTAYVIGSEFNYTTHEFAISYSLINVNTETLLEGSFLPKSVSDAIKTPYGLAVDTISKNIYITDATDYVSPGKLYCIDKNGDVAFLFTTGDIPAHFAFVPKTTIVQPEKKK